MTTSADVSAPIQHTDGFFIGGEWVTPSSDSTITVIDSHTEQNYLTVAEAGHGGFKQSGIGREGGIDGLLPFLESKAMLLDGPTARYVNL